MSLVIVTDPRELKRVCRPDFCIPGNLLTQMFALIQERRALGLAAPQVGIDARLFVTYWGAVFVNPRIVEFSGSLQSEEGCLCLPGVTAKVKRWFSIRLADGSTYRGQEAIVIQHELEHLDGILITDKCDESH